MEIMEAKETAETAETAPIDNRISRKWLWALPVVGFCAFSLCVLSLGLILWPGWSNQADTRGSAGVPVDQVTAEEVVTATSPITGSSLPTAVSAEGDRLARQGCEDSFFSSAPDLTAPLLSPITFASGEGSDGWPQNPTFQFTTTITTVQASFGYAGMENGMSWERLWYFGDQEILRQTGVWDAGSRGQLAVYAQLGVTSAVPGQYRLEIYLEEALAGQGSFAIYPEDTQIQRPVEVAYTTWDGRRHELHLLNLDTNETRPLIEFARQPSWSPDGVGLLFLAEPGVEAGTAGLWVFNANQQEFYQLNEATFFRSLNWSPHRIFAASSKIEDEKPRLLLWNLSQGTAFRGPLGEDPSWSLEGRRLAFRGCHDDAWSISTIEVISNVFQVDSLRALTTGDDSQPAWSPDGRQIAFVRQTEDNRDIYTATPEGSQVKRLTDHPGADVSPAWTPDNRLLYYSQRSGKWGLYLMDADGSDQQLLLETASPADWEPDQPAVSPNILPFDSDSLAQKPRVQVPAGRGILVVSNAGNNDEMTFTIDNVEHKIGPFRYKTIPLAPGHYTWTASWPAKVSRTGIADITIGQVAYPIVER